MKIGALSSSTGVPIDTIRHYEREGLLPEAARTDGNYRIYETAHAQRLSFIRHCRGLDMTLDEIRILLHFKDAPSEDCGEVNALLDEHIGHVAHRIRELRALEKQLRELRETCRAAQDARHCGILNQLDSMASQDRQRPRKATGHVHGAHTGGFQAPIDPAPSKADAGQTTRP
jgi:Cd(II)/Pb(II)-responsive transcriptional regulator